MSIDFRFRFLGLTVLAGLAAIAPAQLISADKSQSITNAAQDYMAANKIKGMSVVVGRGNTIIYTRGFGNARDGFLTTPAVKATGDTVFRLASVSKSITAILAMGFVEQGKLDLSKPTRHYFGQLPSKHTHTIKQILSHMSGIRHYEPVDAGLLLAGEYLSMKTASQLFWNDALRFTPGREFYYSTHAFTILGGALETIGGGRYRDLIVNRISTPHNLPTLKVENRSVANSKRSNLFEVVGGFVIGCARAENITWKSPGGGLECSGNDLCRLGMKLLQGQILKPATVDQMFTKQAFNNRTLGGYGLGWPLGSHLGERVASHTGEQQGAQTVWRLYPAKGLVVVVLSNTRGHDPNALARQVADIIL